MSTLSTNFIQSLAGKRLLNTTGSILQVVQTVKSDTFSAAPNGTWTDITGLSLSITPTSTTNKILLIVSVAGGGSATTPKIRVLRGSTPVGVGDTAGSRASALMGTFYPVDTNQMVTFTNHFFDSPSTTSSLTYKLQLINDNTQTVFINRSVSDGDAVVGTRTISTITAMEIVA